MEHMLLYFLKFIMGFLIKALCSICSILDGFFRTIDTGWMQFGASFLVYVCAFINA